MSLERLREDYPYPPRVPIEHDFGIPKGWLTGPREVLKRFLPATIVVELGSWLGESARFMIEHGAGTVICIDHWLGSLEHHRQYRRDLPFLYQHFVNTNYGYRGRIIPIRIDINAGIELLTDYEIVPDLIYLDGAHDADSVSSNLLTIRRCFPKTTIVGDDWDWPSVRDGILGVLGPVEIQTQGNCWYV